MSTNTPTPPAATSTTTPAANTGINHARRPGPGTDGGCGTMGAVDAICGEPHGCPPDGCGPTACSPDEYGPGG
ncbi:hypothetical protein [Nonomuraea bangladeshensis]|uniref:hypothetical protein n=1 Tax=Nonomuraea bangladeshensis TaxID=404385 RepID=UPI0031E16B25